MPRHRTTDGYGKLPRRWNRKAERANFRPLVFCASMGDVFDNEVPREWRVDLWALLRETPYLRWIFLTKRIGNASKMLPPDWPYPHAALMAALESQDVWDRDFPKLMRVPAAWHGVSAEPLLDAIDIGDARPDWIITGGESGFGFVRWTWGGFGRCAINARGTESRSISNRAAESGAMMPGV